MDGMLRGFESIFGNAKQVHIVVSEEAATYKPEMAWLASQMKNSEFRIQNSDFTDFKDDDAVYRFFELFDLANVPNAKKIFELAAAKKIRLTPPPKPIFVESQSARFLAAGIGRSILQPFTQAGPLHMDC
jgi:hypothetical protein